MSSPTNLFRTPLQLGVTNAVDGPWVLDVSGSPNGVLTAPRGSLALREDVGQLWQNLNGATSWTMLGAGGSSLYPDDTPLTWGNGTSVDGGNVEGVMTTAFGPRAFSLAGEAYVGVGGVSDSANFVFATGSMTVTDATTGPNSGLMMIGSGATNCTDAGGTGGDTGDFTAGSGAAGALFGNSGNTGISTWRSGNSSTGNSGISELVSGNAGDVAGNARISAGLGTTRSGDVEITVSANAAAAGVISVSGQICTPPSALENTGADAQAGVSYQTKRFAFNGSSGPLVIPVRRPKDGSGFVILTDLMFLKTGAAGALGDVISIRTAGGGTVWASLDLTGVASGTVLRLGTAGVTVDSTVASVGANVNIVVEATQGGVSVEGVLNYFYTS